MTAVDLKHLSKFEKEWVALTSDWKVVGHAAKLSLLRDKLGDSAASYRYFFVPSSSVGFSSLCRI